MICRYYGSPYAACRRYAALIFGAMRQRGAAVARRGARHMSRLYSTPDAQDAQLSARALYGSHVLLYARVRNATCDIA